MSLHHLSPQQLAEIRQQMLAFSYSQIQDSAAAEDLVQDALANACQYEQHFKAQASFKTWVFAILKHKIIDYFRAQQKFTTHHSSPNDDISDLVFQTNGHWNREVFLPSEWQGTEQSVYQQQFWDILDICLNNMPALHARVFLMRVYLEMGSEEICHLCQISTANLHTCLYRARLRLQVCLSEKWFNGL